ncbi:MAG: uroporphyrinogen-III synthase, partial [Gammaproteobacteria bacterium]
MLNGARILVTRPAHQAENLCRLITERGGSAIRFPALAIAAMDDACTIKNTLLHLEKFQWLVFISANAATMHSYYLDGGKIAHLKSTRIAAIGRATAQALALSGLPVDLMPESGYNSEALLAMPQMQQIDGQNCLIVRGEGGREELASALRRRGANVEYLNVYKRIIPGIDSSPVLLLLAQDILDVITITSGEALQNLLIMLDKEYHQKLFAIPLVVISDRIRQIASGMGFKRIAV